MTLSKNIVHVQTSFRPPFNIPLNLMQQVHDYRRNNLSPSFSQGDFIQFNPNRNWNLCFGTHRRKRGSNEN